MLPGMAYVMLGRCECIQDVFITLGKEESTSPPPIKRNKPAKQQKKPVKKDLDTSKIKCSSAAKEENESLKERSKVRQKETNAIFEEDGILESS